MCIIAYAPKGIDIPEVIIDNMYTNNPDGAGIMWKASDKDCVHIQKGFMSVSSLKKFWRKHIKPEYEAAIHCRIATSGKISTATCHPFAVRPSVDKMKKGKDSCDMAVMHNGIFAQYTPKAGMACAYSDSMVFASQTLYSRKHALLQGSAQAENFIEQDTKGSRVLIFRQGGEALKFGRWEEKFGVFFSNSSYEEDYFSYRSLGGNYDAYWEKYYAHLGGGLTGTGYGETSKVSVFPGSEEYWDIDYEGFPYTNSEYDDYINCRRLYHSATICIDKGLPMSSLYDIEDLLDTYMGAEVVDHAFETIAGDRMILTITTDIPVFDDKSKTIGGFEILNVF